MAVRLSTGARNAMMNGPGLLAFIDGDAGPAQMRIYTGAQPASADTPPSGTLLATIPLNDPAFAMTGAGTATLDNTPVPTGVGVAAGTAGWCRISDNSGDSAVDGNISSSGGGGDFEIQTTTISIGLDVPAESGTIVMPGG